MIVTKEGFAVLENDTHLSRWVESSGRLDHDVNIERACRLFQPGEVVVDCGSAIGDWTIALARRVGQHGKVFAVEANLIQVECLRHNMKPFPWVIIFPIAVGAAPGRARINPEPNISASHLTLCSDGELEVTTLDLLLKDVGHIHFMKLDIEGYEFAALWGAQKTIQKHRPRMLIEITKHTRTGARPDDIYGFLKGHNYTWSPFIGSASDDQHDILAEPLSGDQKLNWSPSVPAAL